jgi:hypothetical protein
MGDNYWIVEFVDKDGAWLYEPESFGEKKDAIEYAEIKSRKDPDMRLNVCRVTVEKCYGPD